MWGVRGDSVSPVPPFTHPLGSAKGQNVAMRFSKKKKNGGGNRGARGWFQSVPRIFSGPTNCQVGVGSSAQAMCVQVPDFHPEPYEPLNTARCGHFMDRSDSR